MKILLDECVPRKLKPLLTGHTCRTASEAGFLGKKNGILLRLAEAAGYDALITIDRGMEKQQNLRGRRISVLILKGRSGRLKDLAPLISECIKVLSTIVPGQVRRIER
jgi:predicted nuclease of predicted toxin-antitoxin system